MQTTSIYALCDPRTGAVRYVGKANNPAYRFRQHVAKIGNCNAGKHRWVDELAGAGLRPTLTILEAVGGDAWQAREKFWIAHYQEFGQADLNVEEGGKASAPSVWRGKKFSLDTRRRMSLAKIGKKLSEETKQRMSRAKRGNKIWLGRKHTSKTRQKMSQNNAHNRGMLGRKMTEEAKNKIRNSRLHFWQSGRSAVAKTMLIERNKAGLNPEARSKISAAVKARPRDEHGRLLPKPSAA